MGLWGGGGLMSLLGAVYGLLCRRVWMSSGH